MRTNTDSTNLGLLLGYAWFLIKFGWNTHLHEDELHFINRYASFPQCHSCVGSNIGFNFSNELCSYSSENIRLLFYFRLFQPRSISLPT